jgi:hypothetical protein
VAHGCHGIAQNRALVFKINIAADYFASAAAILLMSPQLWWANCHFRTGRKWVK